MNRIAISICVFLLATPALGQSVSSVQYLANEGVMVSYNDSKILFDPLFDNDYGRYQMLTDAMRDAIIAGRAPYDEIDAVFVSHYHGDHFSARYVLDMLLLNDEVRLYAPAQAVAAIREISTADDERVFSRVTGLDLEHGDEPVSIDSGDLTIEAVFIPHSGWPSARTDVQNIAFRITISNISTTVHLGDADARDVHFASDEAFWEETPADLALPPYWFFTSDQGPEIIEDRIGATAAIGIHVPEELRDPAKRPEKLLFEDIFTSPGEGRTFRN